jgi:hypothetical protein
MRPLGPKARRPPMIERKPSMVWIWAEPFRMIGFTMLSTMLMTNTP